MLRTVLASTVIKPMLLEQRDPKIQWIKEDTTLVSASRLARQGSHTPCRNPGTQVFYFVTSSSRHLRVHLHGQSEVMGTSVSRLEGRGKSVEVSCSVSSGPDPEKVHTPALTWPHLAAREAGSRISRFWVLDSMYPVTRHSRWKDGKTDLGEQDLINATIIFLIKK